MIYATEQQVIVTAGIVIIVAVVALFTGMWWGHGRALEEAAEEEKWRREEAKARRTHPVYRQPPETAHEPHPYCLDHDQPLDWCHHDDPWLPPDETVLNPTEVISPGINPEELSWTGEIKAMNARFQEDIERLLGGTDEQLRGITR